MRLRRLRPINPIVSVIVFFVIGITLVIAAIAANPNNVTCDGQTMNVGDICIHSINGAETSRNTINQQRQSQQNTRIIEIIGALLCFGTGTFFIFRFNKARVALKNSTLDTVSKPDHPQKPEADPPLQSAFPLQTGTFPSLTTRDLKQTGAFPSLLTGTHPSLPSRDPRQTGTYPSLLTGTHLSLTGRTPQQTGTHPSLQSSDTQQPKTHRPAQGDNPQPGTTAQFRAYRLIPNDHPQSDANPPPPPDDN